MIDIERLRVELRRFFQDAFKTHQNGQITCGVPWAAKRYKAAGMRRSGADKLRNFFLDGLAYNYPIWYDGDTRSWYIDLQYWRNVESVLWWVNNYDFNRLYK